jgi:hypothetical protein
VRKKSELALGLDPFCDHRQFEAPSEANDRYVPNAAHAEVCEFLANFRKLREMLNEVCAINAELLRRRESLD